VSKSATADFDWRRLEGWPQARSLWHSQARRQWPFFKDAACGSLGMKAEIAVMPSINEFFTRPPKAATDRRSS
jgi:hypothetical protein